MDKNSLFAELMAQPSKMDEAKLPVLKEIQEKYPFMQANYLFLAKADKNYVPKAALYCGGEILHSFLNTNDATAAVEGSEKIIITTTQQNSYNPTIETPNALPGSDAHLINTTEGDSLTVEVKKDKNFFAFENELSTDLVPEPPHIETVVPEEPDVNFVSKYDDDKLPYSFLWWLAKTRKEHEQIFQPYAQPSAQGKKQVASKKDAEFQQQYVEHIFHIQTPFDVADHLAEYPKRDGNAKKGAEIIDTFIKKDPSISAPKLEQINSENKAKKSAEENYDLVTETLAKIYIEQMLYPKAIDTYRKLSLKYPEKSLYFADLINSLEKKL